MTHGVQYLPHVDCIIVLEGGRISEVGTYDELMKRGEDFSKFLDEYATKQDDQQEKEEEGNFFTIMFTKAHHRLLVF